MSKDLRKQGSYDAVEAVYNGLSARLGEPLRSFDVKHGPRMSHLFSIFRYGEFALHVDKKSLNGNFNTGRLEVDIFPQTRGVLEELLRNIPGWSELRDVE